MRISIGFVRSRDAWKSETYAKVRKNELSKVVTNALLAVQLW